MTRLLSILLLTLLCAGCAGFVCIGSQFDFTNTSSGDVEIQDTTNMVDWSDVVKLSPHSMFSAGISAQEPDRMFRSVMLTFSNTLVWNPIVDTNVQGICFIHTGSTMTNITEAAYILITNGVVQTNFSGGWKACPSNEFHAMTYDFTGNTSAPSNSAVQMLTNDLKFILNNQ